MESLRRRDSLAAIFNLLDSDGSGFIDQEELPQLFRLMGINAFTDPGKMESACKAMSERFDSNGDGRYSLNEFLEFGQALLSAEQPSDIVDEPAFSQDEFESQVQVPVTTQVAFRRKGSSIKSEAKQRRLQFLFNSVDEDRSGFIGKAELEVLLRDPSLFSSADRRSTLGVSAENAHRRRSKIPGMSDTEFFSRYADSMMALLDTSGDGSLDFEEFCDAFAPLIRDDGSINKQTIFSAESSILLAEVTRLLHESSDLRERCSMLEQAATANLSSERFGQHQINKDTEEIIDRLETKLDHSEKDNAALRTRIKALHDRNKELQAALEAHNSAPGSAPTKRTFSVEPSDLDHDEIHALRMSKDRLQKEMTDFREQTIAAVQEFERLQKIEREDNSQLVEDLNSRLNAAQRELDGIHALYESQIATQLSEKDQSFLELRQLLQDALGAKKHTEELLAEHEEQILDLQRELRMRGHDQVDAGDSTPFDFGGSRECPGQCIQSAQLRGEIRDMRQELDFQAQTTARSRGDLAAAQAQVQTLLKDLERLQHEAESLKQEGVRKEDSARAQRLAVEQELKQWQDLMTTAQSQRLGVETENKILTKKLQEVAAQQEHQEQQAFKDKTHQDRLKSILSKLAIASDPSKSEQAAPQLTEVSDEQLIAQIGNAVECIADLRRDLSTMPHLQQSLGDVETEAKSLRQQNLSLDKKLAQTSKLSQDTQAALESELAKAHNESDALAAKLQETQRTLLASTSNAALETEMTSVMDENAKLKARLKELKEVHASAAAQSQAVEAADAASLASLADTAALVANELQALQASHAALEAELAKSRTENSVLAAKLLQAFQKTPQKTLEQAEPAQSPPSEKSGLAQKLQELQETIKAILSAPTGSKNVDATTLARLADAIALMLEELRTTQAKQTGLESELAKAKGESTALTAKLQDTHSVQQALSESKVALEVELASALNDKSNLEARLKGLQEAHASAAGRAQAMEAADAESLTSLADTAALVAYELQALQASQAALEAELAKTRTENSVLAAKLLQATQKASQKTVEQLEPAPSRTSEKSGLATKLQELQEALKAALATPTGSKSMDTATLTSLTDALGLMLEELQTSQAKQAGLESELAKAHSDSAALAAKLDAQQAVLASKAALEAELASALNDNSNLSALLHEAELQIIAVQRQVALQQLEIQQQAARLKFFEVDFKRTNLQIADEPLVALRNLSRALSVYACDEVSVSAVDGQNPAAETETTLALSLHKLRTENATLASQLEAALTELKAAQSRSPARPPGSTPAPPLSRAHSLCESRTPVAPFSRAQSLGDSSPADGTLGADLDWDDDQANLSFVSAVKTSCCLFENVCQHGNQKRYCPQCGRETCKCKEVAEQVRNFEPPVEKPSLLVDGFAAGSEAGDHYRWAATSPSPSETSQRSRDSRSQGGLSNAQRSSSAVRPSAGVIRVMPMVASATRTQTTPAAAQGMGMEADGVNFTHV